MSSSADTGSSDTPDGTRVPEPNRNTDGSRRVRFTLDLARTQHRFLKLFAVNAEVDASVVMRTLLALLEEDDALEQRVLDRLGPVEDP